MPARIADTPRGVPFERLIFKFRLGEPQHEVVLVALVRILLHALAHADRQILGVMVVKDIVAFKLAGVKIDVAAGKVAVTLVDERRNDMNVVIDKTRRGLDGVGLADVQLAAVVKNASV